MKKTVLAISLFTLLFSGCATYSKMNQMKKFEQISNNYETAIRWADFETASYLRKSDMAAKDPMDFDCLERVKVISYELKQIAPIEAEKIVIQIHQAVEVKYYKVDDLVQRTLTDRQVWEYDEEKESWFLMSKFPDFKCAH